MDGATAFTKFRQRLGIARNILADRLRKPVEHGILGKSAATDGRRHTYRLTEAGQDLFTAVVALRQWGERHAFAPGEPHSILVDDQGRELPELHPLGQDGAPLSVEASQVRKLLDPINLNCCPCRSFAIVNAITRTAAAFEKVFDYTSGMSAIAAAYDRLQEAFEELRVSAESTLASDAELLSVLTVAEGFSRQLDHLTVSTTAALQRRGSFAEHGYAKPEGALADLLGCDSYEAHRRVVAAEQACERVGIDGTVLAARLPATGKAFAAGQASLRHVEVIAALLGSAAARRLTDGRRAGLEEQLAVKAGEYPPAQLRKWGTQLIEALDEDGPEPDDAPPDPVNELHLRRHRNGAGGTITGRFDDAAMFDAIAGVIDAKAKPLDGDDRRGVGRRQAEALADACGFVLAHGDRATLPETGGRRPHLNVLIRLEDLEQRARSAMLDFGGTLSPESLRMLACDAGVVPIVMNGAGQPLDVGRSTRVVPDGLRRAVTARDRGCAHPGCDRLPSWCEIHHAKWWEHGGLTELNNLVSLCKVHHRLVHHSGWVVRIRDGLPEFIPPKWIDPAQVPRRNPRHVPMPARVAAPGRRQSG